MNTKETLDRNSPVPLYYQLYMILQEQIKEGQLKPGDMLPTEISLMEKYTVSRATVRQAVLDLVHKGYVVREKSKGTFVKDLRSLTYQEKVKGFAAASPLHGRVELTNKVLAKEIITAPGFLCDTFNIEPGTKLFYLKRVRSIEQSPAVYTEDWVPYALCPGIEKIDFLTESLLNIMETRYNVVPAMAERTFECCHAETEEQMKELNVRKTSPLLHLTNIVYTADRTPMEYCLAVINGKYTVVET